MWPLFLLPLAAVFLGGKDGEDGVLSPPTKPTYPDLDPTVPPWHPSQPGGVLPGYGEWPHQSFDCDWIYNADFGADDAPLVAAYAGLRNNPFAGPGDWYYFADVAESFGAHDVASCARQVGDNMAMSGG